MGVETMVRSIFRAADILACLNNNINTITEISQNCKLSVSTTYRLLEALQEKGLSYQDPRDKKYYLGYFLTKLSLDPISSHKYLILCADEEMQQLSKAIEEEIALYVHPGCGNKMIRLLEVSREKDLKILGENRILRSMAGSSAQVLLSQFSDKELEALLKNIKIEQFTESTITDKAELMARVKEVREQGYSCTHNQRLSGVLGISVPIINYFCPATLCTMGAEYSLKSKVPKLLAELQASAKRISDNLKSVDLKLNIPGYKPRGDIETRPSGRAKRDRALV
jgi:IclR family KDG regulon transcriptional repressor